jgi:hypothetical protein
MVSGSTARTSKFWDYTLARLYTIYSGAYISFHNSAVDIGFTFGNNPEGRNDPPSIGQLSDLMYIITSMPNEDGGRELVEGYVVPFSLLNLPDFRYRATGNVLRVFLNVRCDLWVCKILLKRSVVELRKGSKVDLRDQVADVIDVK